VLSALHGMLSGNLRRLTRSEEAPLPSSLQHAPAVIVLGVLIIVILVVIKPF
jgi:protoporphyrinogen IX oxidase